MSLAKTLATVTPQYSNRGCRTCRWLEGVSVEDRAAWDEWIAAEHSLTQLWDIVSTDPDNPLRISIAGLREHVRKHHK